MRHKRDTGASGEKDARKACTARRHAHSLSFPRSRPASSAPASARPAGAPRAGVGRAEERPRVTRRCGVDAAARPATWRQDTLSPRVCQARIVLSEDSRLSSLRTTMSPRVCQARIVLAARPRGVAASPPLDSSASDYGCWFPFRTERKRMTVDSRNNPVRAGGGSRVAPAQGQARGLPLDAGGVAAPQLSEGDPASGLRRGAARTPRG